MCLADSGELEWAFKDSFLAYIDSSIANGSWNVEGGVEDQGTTFVWPLDRAAVDPELAIGAAEFDGSVHFTGHDGVLNTTIANPTLDLSADGAYLMLDVTTETQEGDHVEATQVRFARLDLDAGTVTSDSEGTLLLDAIPAVLTEEGAEVFGTYEAGEELAPVTATLAAESGCLAVLAGETIVQEPAQAEPTPSAEPTGSADAETEVVEEGGTQLWLWIAIGVLAAAAVVAAAVATRRRMK